MTTAGTAYIDLRARLDQFNRDLKAAEGSALVASKSMGQKFSAIGTKASALGRKMTVGLTLPLALGFKASMDAASDLNESMSKVDVVFGKAAKGIQEWSEDAAESMGISRQQALEATGTFGNLFTAMEIGVKPAADMSESLVELASDLASFNNADPTEVLESLRAGLLGEAEPMRKFGVQLSAVRIEQEAVNMGLAEAGEELTAAQKSQAAYSIILKDTSKAQGDFARTSDGVANSQRIATARFKDAAATLGTKLLPIGQMVLQWAGDLAGKFNKLSGRTQKFALAVAGIAAVAGPAIGAIGAISTALGFLAAHPAVLAIAAIAALAAGLVVAYRKSETFREIVNQVGAALKNLWAAIQPLVSSLRVDLTGAFEQIGPVMNNVALPALRAYTHLLTTIINLIAQAISAVGSFRAAMSEVNIPATPVGLVRNLLDGRAAGGPVAANTPYIVGERGPELFLSQTAGRIVPNHQLAAGGGTSVNMTFNIKADSFTNAEKLARFVGREAEKVIIERNHRDARIATTRWG